MAGKGGAEPCRAEPFYSDAVAASGRTSRSKTPVSQSVNGSHDPTQLNASSWHIEYQNGEHDLSVRIITMTEGIPEPCF